MGNYEFLIMVNLLAFICNFKIYLSITMILNKAHDIN
jgi:hypothetical protein